MPAITTQNATELCQEILDSLLRDTEKFWSSLQSGKGEDNKGGLIETAITKWLESQKKNEEFLVLMEHGKIDFALIRRDSVGQCRLKVEAVIECKFNYAKQESEISQRILGSAKKPKSALVQAQEYASKYEAKEAYVLYLIAAPQRNNNCPSGPSPDAGWQYWSGPRGKLHTLGDAVKSVKSLVDDVNRRDKCVHQLIGEAHDKDNLLYCGLIQCTDLRA